MPIRLHVFTSELNSSTCPASIVATLLRDAYRILIIGFVRFEKPKQYYLLVLGENDICPCN
jgi:hypothetical protein